jgi:hypothetical protein
MRTGYLLLSLLAPLSSFAGRGRKSDYTPIPPLVSEEDAEETIQSFDLSSRDRQAVFGDISKLAPSLSIRDQAETHSDNQETTSDRLSCLHRQAARRKMQEREGSDGTE